MICIKEHVASEDEAYKPWSTLISNIHKTGYIHPVPESHLAKPKDFSHRH